jgi:hypothetical protein
MSVEIRSTLICTLLYINTVLFMHSLYKVHKVNTQWDGHDRQSICLIPEAAQSILIKFYIGILY